MQLLLFPAGLLYSFGKLGNACAAITGILISFSFNDPHERKTPSTHADLTQKQQTKLHSTRVFDKKHAADRLY